MSTAAIILTAGFGVLVLAGVPFVIALGAVSIIVVLLNGMEPAIVAGQIIAGSQSFTLIAVPMFMLAGSLMAVSGLTKRLIDIANVLVRHRTGGLAMVVVVASMIFGSISGSAPATTAAIGSMMIPALVKEGYDRSFAASIAISSGVLGPLIPPSIAFVIWGVIAQQSIPRLFLSGIVPGIAIAIGLIIVCYFHAKRRGMARLKAAPWDERVRVFWQGRWALLSPFVVLGGIYGGIFTPTEAAGISCVYTLFIGLFVERTLSLNQIRPICLDAIRTSGVVLAIVVVVALFSVLLAQERVAYDLATYLLSLTHDKWVTLLGINIAMFIFGCFMDEITILLILGPVLIDVANHYGVDPIHFGAIIVTNVVVGMATPPVGYCLFVGMAISGLGVWPITRAIWPQIVVMIIVLLLTTYVPEFALFLAR